MIKLIKEDINKKIGLIKLIQKQPEVSLNHIMDLLGYSVDKTMEVIQLFLNNTEKYDGSIILYGARIKSLGKLKYIGGELDLATNTSLESLGNLEHVDGTLDLEESEISSLGNLKYVGGRFLLRFNGMLNSLEKLEHIGGNCDLRHSKITSIGKLKYVGGCFSIRETPIALKIIDNRNNYKIIDKIQIKGEIYIN